MSTILSKKSFTNPNPGQETEKVARMERSRLRAQKQAKQVAVAMTRLSRERQKAAIKASDE